MNLNDLNKKEKEPQRVEKQVVAPKIESNLRRPDSVTDEIVAMSHLSGILRPKDDRFNKRRRG